MSSTPYAAPLRLDLRPSRRLASLLWAGAGASAIAVLGLDLPWPVRLALLLVPGGVLWRHRRRPPPDSLIWRGDGTWCVSQHGAWHDAELTAGVYRTPALVILPLRFADGHLRRIAIARDMADPQALRRLRVRLMLEPPR